MLSLAAPRPHFYALTAMSACALSHGFTSCSRDTLHLRALNNISIILAIAPSLKITSFIEHTEI